MLESAQILVVDDEKMIREGCSRILRKAGHQVAVAANGPEGLKRILEEPFHIVLLDIKMPGMDGMEVMEILKRKRLNLLVLVITGYATIEMAVEAMKAGAYDLLLKPFSADALRISVNRALDHLRLAQEMERLKEEKERSLRDIANEQSRVRTIINSMACGILVTDNEKNVVLFNPMATRMLNLDFGQVMGRPIGEVVRQGRLVEMVERLFTGQETEITALEDEIEIEGQVVLRARTAPVRDAGNSILGAVTVLQDVTAQKRMDRMKSEFVTMVSHELKAPLAAIQQQLEVLLGGMAGPVNEKQTHFLSRAQTRADGLIRLINELLDLSRIEAGRIVSQQEPLDLAPVIRHVIEFVRPQVEAKGQVIDSSFPETLPLVSADPRNMDEVFINLINNAIKYSPEGGRIEVGADVAGDHLRIRISDTGFGIPKDDLPRIFDKFYRVKNDRTKTITGTGLGLPIAKGIVEAHLGEIKVESQVGQGTTFTIFLPLLKSEPASLPPGNA
ncbi:MAG: ATP-binding protein [Pseudomonadota bacterium]